jgi:hypothetical protein
VSCLFTAAGPLPGDVNAVRVASALTVENKQLRIETTWAGPTREKLVLTMHEQRQSLQKAVPSAHQCVNRAALLEGTGTHSRFDDCGFEPAQTLKSRVDLNADLLASVPRAPVCNE